MVAAEQARLQERERFLERELRNAQQTASPNMATIDEETAIRLLGEEAARVLQTAREAAVQIRARAEDGSARLLREATDEAQRLREEAEIESARRRQDAAADSEAELQMAKQQGRDMVNEARAYRERVLSELARRRELARQQIEQLIHGRDRLLQAFERSRIAAVEVMAELTPLGEPSEYVNLQPTTGPVPIMLPTRVTGTGAEIEVVSEVEVPEVDVFDDLVVTTEQVTEITEITEIAGITEITVIDEDGRIESIEVVETETFVEVVEVVEMGSPEMADILVGDFAPPIDAASAETELDTGTDASVDIDMFDGRAEPVALHLIDANDHPGADAEPDADNVVQLFDAPDPAGIVDGGTESGEVEPETTDPAAGETVDDLFARLRAARSEVVADKVNAKTGKVNAKSGKVNAKVGKVREPVAEPVGAEPVVGEMPVEDLIDVDETIVPLIVSVARRLKRVLADEQNEVLDTLRRKEPVRAIDALLPWEPEQADRYAEAVQADLLAAAVAGACGGDDGRNPAIIRPASDAVTNSIVAPLRERLTRCIDRADGDNADLANQVRSLYREWKTHRIDEHVEEIVRLAYDRGALTVASA